MLDKKIILKCMNDGQRLILVPGKYSYYFKCPFYYRENRPPELQNSSCKTYLSILEKKYISNEIESLMELEELQTGREIEFDVFKIKIVRIEEKFIEVAVKRKE